MGNALALVWSFPKRNVLDELSPPECMKVNKTGFFLVAQKDINREEIENFLKIFAQKECKMIEWDYQKLFDILYCNWVLKEDVSISTKIGFYQNVWEENKKFHLKKHTDGFEFGIKENTKGITLDDVIHFFWRNGIVWNFDLDMLNGIIENPWFKTRSIFITDEWGENKKWIQEEYFDPMFFVEQIRANALQVITPQKLQKSLLEMLIQANNAQNNEVQKMNSDDTEQEEKELEKLEEQKWILAQKLKTFISSQEKSDMHNFVAQFFEIDRSQDDRELPLWNLKSISEWLWVVQHKIEQYKWFLRKRDVLNRPWLENYFRVLLTLRQYILIHQEIVQIITKKI